MGVANPDQQVKMNSGSERLIKLLFGITTEQQTFDKKYVDSS